MEGRFSRYCGAMVGLAAGDALGAPLEGLKAGRIQQIYGEVDDYVDPALAWKDKPWRWRMPGLYTDDTQQALLLADTLVKCHGFDAAFFAGRLVEMAEAGDGLGFGSSRSFGAFRGTGRKFREAVKRLSDGVEPLMAGSYSAGIGPGMRVAPVGLYYADDKEAMTRAAIEQGLVTNRDPRSLEAAAGVAFCVARGAQGRWSEINPEGRVEELVEYIDLASSLIKEDYLSYLPLGSWDHCGRVSSAVRNFRYYIGMEPSQVWKQIVGEANRGFPSFNISSPAQGFALAGPVTAMFLGIISRSYPEGIIGAVNLGRDTDTVAAITGAILGARGGMEKIPENWRKGLINLEQVKLRGDALCQSSFQGLAIEDVIETEKGLTIRESEAREAWRAKLTKPEKKKRVKEKKPSQEKKTTVAGREPTREERVSRRKKLKKPRKVKAPWRGGEGL